MTVPRFHRFVAFALLLPVVVQVQGCKELAGSETVSVSLRNTEEYEYPTVGGDEEGARISSQGSHYSISEIRRDAETHWVAVYVYRPAAGFVGSDKVEIEILTGSDGASAPTNIRRVAFRFDVHN
jgi:hypothetical protein